MYCICCTALGSSSLLDLSRLPARRMCPPAGISRGRERRRLRRGRPLYVRVGAEVRLRLSLRGQKPYTNALHCTAQCTALSSTDREKEGDRRHRHHSMSAVIRMQSTTNNVQCRTKGRRASRQPVAPDVNPKPNLRASISN